MPADSVASPPEQRVLTALYTGAGFVCMVVVIWQQLEPGGPVEAFGRLHERFAAWRRSRVELFEQLEEIQSLPETEGPCTD